MTLLESLRGQHAPDESGNKSAQTLSLIKTHPKADFLGQ